MEEFDKVMAQETDTVTVRSTLLCSAQNQLLLEEEGFNLNIDDNLRFELLDILYQKTFFCFIFLEFP